MFMASMFNRIIVSAALLALISTSHASPTIQHKTLNNGLKVVVAEDHRSPLVMVQVWYAIGGADENPQHLGISHLLEHMMFKGTVRVPNNELKQLNAMYGGSLNAITTANATYYYQMYPKDSLNLALELEADRMSGLYLQYKNFSTEVKVVMEERRQKIEDHASTLAFEKFRSAAYPQNNYQYPVMGYMSNLKEINLSDLQQWYNQWYRPNNATVVIVGDVDSASAIRQVQRYFGDIASEPLQPKSALNHPINVGHRHVDMDDDTQVANLYMGWNVPSLKTASQSNDAYALHLLKYILNGQSTSYLNKQLMQDQNIIAAFNLNYDMVQRGDTLFTITAVPYNNITLKQAQYAIEGVLKQLQRKPLDSEELKNFVNIAKSQYIYQKDTLQGQAVLLGNLEANGFDYQIAQQFDRQIENITPQDIQRVAQTYFNTSNLTTLYLESQKQRLAHQLINEKLDLQNQTPPTVAETPTQQEQ